MTFGDRNIEETEGAEFTEETRPAIFMDNILSKCEETQTTNSDSMDTTGHNARETSVIIIKFDFLSFQTSWKHQLAMANS